MNQFWSLTKLIFIVTGRLGRPAGEPRTNYRPAERPKINYNAFREAYSLFICLPEVPEFSLLSVQSCPGSSR